MVTILECAHHHSLNIAAKRHCLQHCIACEGVRQDFRHRSSGDLVYHEQRIASKIAADSRRPVIQKRVLQVRLWVFEHLHRNTEVVF